MFVQKVSKDFEYLKNQLFILCYLAHNQRRLYWACVNNFVRKLHIECIVWWSHYQGLFLCIKFCLKFRHLFAESVYMIKKSLRNYSVSEALVPNLVKSVESDPYPVRPSTSWIAPQNVEQVLAAIKQNCW